MMTAPSLERLFARLVPLVDYGFDSEGMIEKIDELRLCLEKIPQAGMA